MCYHVVTFLKTTFICCHNSFMNDSIYFNFYFEQTLSLLCFTQRLQTFCHTLLCLHMYMCVYTLIQITYAFLMSHLTVSCWHHNPLSHKYLCVYFLRKKMLSYITTVLSSNSGKLILMFIIIHCAIYVKILPIVSILS